jgi:VWFA-related protein
MPRLSHKTILYGAAGALGGAAAWPLILSVSHSAGDGLLTEALLGSLAGMFIGGFIWSHEAITGRKFRTALKRAAYGALAGLAGGAAGAGLGNTVFSALGRYVVDLGGWKASLGMALSVGLGWAVLGAAIGMSGGAMVRSRDRIGYGLLGGSLGGFIGGLLFNTISTTGIWPALAGLSLLGSCIGAFISLVEEALLSARLKVIKGRHVGREFPLLRDENVIGRDDRSEVCLSGAEGVGLKHALVRRKNGRYSIETEQVGKVVYVNHKLAKNSRLRDGDVIRVGSILLMFTAVRKAAAAALVILFLLSGTTARAADTLQMQITQFDLSAFPEIKAYVSVLDRNSRPVPGLDERSLLVRENGRPVAVKEMRPAGAQGKREELSVALVLDKSGSMEGGKIAQAREALLRFISLMERGDRASLLAFNDKVTELVPLTGSGESLKKAVPAIEPGGHTALYDAIAKGVESLKGAAGRRAVIVLTDGKANRGALDIGQAIESSTKAYVSVFVIGLGEDVRTARLERIAQETGGSYFFTPSEERLASIYETVSNRIRNEYVITYDTEKRGEYLRKVSIELKGGPAAERMYFQPRSSLFGAGTGVPGWAFLVPILCLAGLAAISMRNLERSYKTGHLSLVRGKGSKNEIDVESLVTIGRDERNTFGLFKDDSVEQRHAEVKKEDGRYIIEDMTSSAGTFVNRERVSGRQELRDGDVIDIGQARIVFNEGTRHACAGCGSTATARVKYCPRCGLKAA